MAVSKTGDGSHILRRRVLPALPLTSIIGFPDHRL
jgi:hypothetical protein